VNKKCEAWKNLQRYNIDTELKKKSVQRLKVESDLAKDIYKFHCDLNGHFTPFFTKGRCHKGKLCENIPTLTGITYVVCPKSSCSGLSEDWDVNWWRTPPALLTQQDPVDIQ